MTRRAPQRSARGTGAVTLCVLVALVGLPTAGAAFTYKPHGTLKPGSGTGQKSTKDYVPGMRFPMLTAPAYANSQVYMNGGSQGGGGGQCDKVNYSYPWWDNYCEKRSWTMPLCPSGKGHQGQDIRPGSCKFNTHWVVAAESGTITSIGTYSVYEKSVTGVTHRYLHMKMNALAVKVGQKVTKGQKLGLVDNDFGGTSTTLHLHYDRKMYVSGVGTVYVPTYASLVNSYKLLVGGGCDAAACSKKSGCGAWGACGGFSSTCDTTGTRKRTCTTYACAGSSCKANTKTESQACTVATDGKQVAGWSSWGACKKVGSGCATAGKQTRTRSVCKGGKATTQSGSQSCVVKTDGVVVKGWSSWSACAGFDGPCDESGTQSRARTVCQGGKPKAQSATAACTESKAGVAVSAWGPWSPCGGFDGPCDGSGQRQRSRLVCQAGAATPQIDTASCTVDREGAAVTPWGPWTACVPDAQPCAPSGTRRRTRQVCAGSLQTQQAQLETCVPTCAGGSSDTPDGSGASSDVVLSQRDTSTGGATGLVPRAPSGGCSAAGLAGSVAPAARSSSSLSAAGRPTSPRRPAPADAAPWWALVGVAGLALFLRRVT